MTLEQTSAAIAVLRAAYPRQQFPDESVTFYARKLRDIDGDELVAAIDRLTNRCTFLPSVAEIRQEVAEARLGLPDVGEAWEIATRGGLSNAPLMVRQAVEAVGGRWTILHGENPTATRAQFRRDYEERRQRAIFKEAGALPERRRLRVAPEVRALPPIEDDWYSPGPVMARAARAMVGIERLEPPTEDEIRDAIAILASGPYTEDPADDTLYKAAELVLVDADNAMKETT